MFMHVWKEECVRITKDSSSYPLFLYVDEGCSPETEVPFSLLHGENPTNFTVCKNGKHLVVLTNYRLFASMEEGYYSVPLGLIESTELRQPNDLLILCKDCRSFK